jgi:hypothetical protein
MTLSLKLVATTTLGRKFEKKEAMQYENANSTIAKQKN